MSRPVGSKNKPKIPSNRNGIYLTNLEKQIEGSAMARINAMGWVDWGRGNNYPNLLLDLYNQSPTHRACINFGVQSILGNGVDLDAMQVDGTQVVPNYGYHPAPTKPEVPDWTLTCQTPEHACDTSTSDEDDGSSTAE